MGVRVAEPRARFELLRARYHAARAALDEADVEFQRRYGSGFEQSWLSPADQRRRERLRAVLHKAGESLFEHVQACSPRDWATGVPYVWVCGTLAWEDVVRPLGEALSVVPPLSWGALVPKS